jgi:Holliday junction resolvase RusA-like endonuclease
VTEIRFSELPPSANNLFANGIHGRFKTPRYKAWLTLAGHEINRQKPKPVIGPYTMSIRLGKVRQRRDLSNCCKGLEDILVTYGIVEDDSKCQSLLLEWVDEPGVCIVIIPC